MPGFCSFGTLNCSILSALAVIPSVTYIGCVVAYRHRYSKNNKEISERTFNFEKMKSVFKHGVKMVLCLALLVSALCMMGLNIYYSEVQIAILTFYGF